MFETDSEQLLWRKDAKDFEKRLKKSAWNCLQGKWVGPVLLGDIGAWRWHLCQRLRCCLPCLSESVHLWFKLFVWVALTISVCPRIWGFTHGLRSKRQVNQMTVTVHGCCSIFLAFVHDTWSRSTRLETRTKECNMCKFSGVKTCKRNESECLDTCTCNRRWSREWFE